MSNLRIQAAGAGLLLLAAALAQIMAQPLARLAPARAQPQPQPLTTQDVVQRMVAMNTARTHALHAYTALRRYHVVYDGLGHKSASMTVRVDYQQPGPKHFTVVAESGSGMLRHHVLEPLLKAERRDAVLASTDGSALVPGNYSFQLTASPRPNADFYVLQATPRADQQRFLFRGSIWLNPLDFGIERVVGTLPQSPSFWVTKAHFDYHSQKIGDFWLPATNQTLAHIRFFGHAELEISYQSFDLTSVSPVRSPTAVGDHP